MRTTTLLHGALMGILCLSNTLRAEEKPSYLLKANRDPDSTATVAVELEVGGETLTQEETEVQRLPVSVAGKLLYHERFIQWSPDPKQVTRSVRHYESATIKVEEEGTEQRLPEGAKAIVAEIRDGHAAVNGMDHPLTRDQLDLINLPGNSLAIDRLLPGREMSEGDDWDHDAASIGALLGMDHVAVCEVRSVVTGESHQQVQIRLAGTVHGTIDGAPTEMQLRGAYLFHLQEKRIAKFNLAIQENRTANEVVPGWDIVAQVKLKISPASKENALSGDMIAGARDTSRPLARDYLYEDKKLGFRFLHDLSWYITAEEHDVLSLRCLQNGDWTAHCNISTLPVRSAGRQTTLEQFEREVRQSLDEHLESVKTSRQWTTPQGHTCLGVIALGKVEGVPVEWRYYLVASDNLPRMTIAVTINQSLVEQFDDADRQIIASMELAPLPTKTANRASTKKDR